MAVTHPHPNRLAWRRLSSVYRGLCRTRSYTPGMALEVAADAVGWRYPPFRPFAEQAALRLPEVYAAQATRFPR